MKSSRLKVICIAMSLMAVILYALYMMKNNEVLKTSIKYIYEDVLLNNNDINLMLGSSSIVRLNHAEYISCGDWLNRGIGGATISDISNYIALSPTLIMPSNILLYAGENDISDGLSVAQTVYEYEKLLTNIIQKYPSSELHIIAIKPSPAREKFWKKFNMVNESLEKYLNHMQGSQFYTPNWGARLSGNTEAFLNDGIHLTEKGYTIFTSGINELCNSK